MARIGADDGNAIGDLGVVGDVRLSGVPGGTGPAATVVRIRPVRIQPVVRVRSAVLGISEQLPDAVQQWPDRDRDTHGDREK